MNEDWTVNPARLQQHKAQWKDLPMTGVPIPPDHDGENAILHDLAELVLERVELINGFDPRFVQAWLIGQINADGIEEAA